MRWIQTNLFREYFIDGDTTVTLQQKALSFGLLQIRDPRYGAAYLPPHDLSSLLHYIDALFVESEITHRANPVVSIVKEEGGSIPTYPFDKMFAEFKSSICLYATAGEAARTIESDLSIIAPDEEIVICENLPWQLELWRDHNGELTEQVHMYRRIAVGVVPRDAIVVKEPLVEA